jgi:imidazolonepropionase-like amidohydrolase
MVALLERRMPMHVHAHRADDIATALRIAREFEVELVLHHGTEAYLVAEELAESGIPVVYGPIAWWPYKSETRQIHGRHVRTLRDRGVQVTLTTDAPVIPIQHLDDNFVEVREAGVSSEEILEMLTIDSARILGVADRVGSLEPGKDADLVVLEGRPMEPGTRVEKLFVGGDPLDPARMLRPH